MALGSQVLVNATTFMVVPFAVLYLADTLKLSAGQAGTVVAVLLLSSRLMAVGTGPLAERIGHRDSMALGLVVRGAGLGLFAVGRDWTVLAAAAGVAGVGGALYEPALNGLLARQPSGERLRLFATRNQLLNVGVAVGPPVGAAAVYLGSTAPFVVAALLTVVMGTAIWLVPDESSPAIDPVRARRGLRLHCAKALRSRSFVRLCPILVLWWALFTQLTVSVPLAARAVGGSERWVGVVFLANGVTGVLALGVVRRLGRGIAPARLLTYGLSIAALGFTLLPLAPSGWWLISCIVLYTVGESLALPAVDLLVASCTDAETASTFFGLALAAWAVGGVVGVFLGSWLMAGPGRVLPWVVYGGLGLAATIAVVRQRRPSYDGLLPGTAAVVADDREGPEVAVARAGR
ncbi:MAG: MFS transporter [Acidimicrobiales bacterium]